MNLPAPSLSSLHVLGPLVGNYMCYGSANICFGHDDASNQLG